MKKWKKLSEEVLIKTPIFEFKSCDLFDFQKNANHKFYVLDSKDWVNIIPITKNNEIVLIRQYRAGSDEITIEVPGGIIEPGETPEQTAKRELEEETGCLAKEFKKIGEVYPNPAFITNKCHYVVALDVEPGGTIHFDPSEYIEKFTVPMSEVSKMIKRGEIKHAITIDAFLYLHLHGIKGFKL
jgi:ADP-ribose pyrophosphatase